MHRNSSFNWDSLNWKLPNIVLCMIYDFPNFRIAVSRSRLFKGKPGWNLGGYSKLANDPVFLEELEAEKKKAKALGIAVNESKIEEWLKYKQDYAHPGGRKKAMLETFN